MIFNSPSDNRLKRGAMVSVSDMGRKNIRLALCALKIINFVEEEKIHCAAILRMHLFYKREYPCSI